MHVGVKIIMHLKENKKVRNNDNHLNLDYNFLENETH